MAVNETIVTGRKFRKCIDAATKAWQRISFWTKSSDVEFEDGKNAETKLGAIDGITDSLENTSSRMAASAKAVSTLNNNLTTLEANFQNGCDTIVQGCTTYGSSPASNNPRDIVTAIKQIYSDRYNIGYNSKNVSRIQITANVWTSYGGKQQVSTTLSKASNGTWTDSRYGDTASVSLTYI